MDYGERKSKPDPPFEKKPRKTNVKTRESQGLFEEVDKGNGIKQGAFRKFLGLKGDEAVTPQELRKIIRVDPGDTFKFRSRTLKQTERSKKQAQLALNMQK